MTRDPLLAGIRRCLALAVLAIAVMLMAGTSVRAAAITWLTPVHITTADAALSQAGTIDYAVGWTGSGSATTVTLGSGQKVVFNAGTINGTGLVQISGAYGICGGTCAGFSGTSNANFNAAIDGFAYDGTETVTLTGLVVGTSYTVQIFSLDDRGCCASKTQIFEVGASGDSSASFAHSANDYLLGSFTANATTEAITAIGQQNTGACNANSCTNVNAVVLYTNASASSIPEPGSVVLLGGGRVGLVGMRRRRMQIVAIVG